MFFLIMTCQTVSNLPDGKNEQNTRVVTILTVKTANATMQHSDPHHGGLLRSC